VDRQSRPAIAPSADAECGMPREYARTSFGLIVEDAGQQ
jgi:hypothetical protein